MSWMFFTMLFIVILVSTSSSVYAFPDRGRPIAYLISLRDGSDTVATQESSLVPAEATTAAQPPPPAQPQSPTRSLPDANAGSVPGGSQAGIPDISTRDSNIAGPSNSASDGQRDGVLSDCSPTMDGFGVLYGSLLSIESAISNAFTLQTHTHNLIGSDNHGSVEGVSNLLGMKYVEVGCFIELEARMLVPQIGHVWLSRTLKATSEQINNDNLNLVIRLQMTAWTGQSAKKTRRSQG
jgi:hypothetical protein